jgi:hypothetical protein
MGVRLLTLRRSRLLGLVVTGHLGPINVCGGRVLRICPSAFVIIRNHDWVGSPSTNDSASVVGHGKVNMKSDSLPMVAAVASDTEGEDNGARGEAQDFRTIELNDVERLSRTIGRSICSLGRVRVIPLGAYTLSQFTRNTLCLRKKKFNGKANYDDGTAYFSTLTARTTNNARMRGRCARNLHSEL